MLYRKMRKEAFSLGVNPCINRNDYGATDSCIHAWLLLIPWSAGPNATRNSRVGMVCDGG